MNKKILKQVSIILLFISIFLVSCFSALSDFKIDDLGNMTYTNIKNDLSTHFQSSQFSQNIEYKEGVYYVSYLKEVNGFRQNFIASSSDLENWTTQQMTSDSSNKYLCHLYLDVDLDLICIKYKNSQSFEYWIMDYGSTTWSSITTEWDESSFYDYFLGVSKTIYKIWDYIWITAGNSSSLENFVNFQNNFEDGYYNITFVGGFDSSSLAYENISTNNIQERIIENTLFSEYHSIFGGNPIQHVYIDESTYKYYNVTNDTFTLSWIYHDDSDNLYLFYLKTAGNSDYLYYMKWTKSTETWGSEINVPLNNLTRVQWLDMIEGTDYLWGIYRTKPTSSPQIYSYLHRFKIAKSNMSLIEDKGIGGTLRNASYIGNIYGLKDARWRSSNILITDELIVTYGTGVTGVSGFEASPSSVLPFDMWVYYEDTNDKLEDRIETISYDCLTDNDCISKFGSSFECINLVCSIIVYEDANYTEGDIAYDLNSFLSEIGIKSVGSKIMFSIFIIMLINILITIIWASIGMEPNGIVNGVLSLLTLFLCAYLGLVPIWIMVAIFILIAGITAFMFGGRS